MNASTQNHILFHVRYQPVILAAITVPYNTYQAVFDLLRHVSPMYNAMTGLAVASSTALNFILIRKDRNTGLLRLRTGSEFADLI